MIIEIQTSSGVQEYNLYEMTVSEIMGMKFAIDHNIILAKVRYQYSLLYTGQTLIDKIYAINMKLEAGFNQLLDSLYDNSVYIDLAKQYIQDRYDEEILIEEEYNILYGILNSTLPE